MSYPDLPHIPELPAHRVAEMSVHQVLEQSRGALLTALRAVEELEAGAGGVIQLALVRMVVIESRRSTFLLQRLSSRVDGFDDWYAPRRQAMGADPLMIYFRDLRTQIEKRGLPGAMAEILDPRSGEAMADVAVYEDRHGIYVTGALRPEAPPDVRDLPQPTTLHNFRLPDPPTHHLGEPLRDRRFTALARLAIDYLLSEVIEGAERTFGSTQGDG